MGSTHKRLFADEYSFGRGEYFERGETVQVIYERCCGLDVHKRTITGCVLKWLRGAWQKKIRQFGTTTKDLLALSDWLVGEGCTHVAMESTGVYWKPVYNILEGQFELLVVNAQHLKAVPGRKTDVRDAE